MENAYWDIFGSERANIYFECVVQMVSGLIRLCGMVGNGTVIWLLGFRLRRNPVHVYILNLAVADFTYVFSFFIYKKLSHWSHSLKTVFLIKHFIRGFSFLAGQGLLMAVSTERCVSVLWPLWYKCRRPEHLSTIACALIWGLSFCVEMLDTFCFQIGNSVCYMTSFAYYYISPIVSLVLCVSSLTMILRVQCCSQTRRPGKLYLTTLLTVLAFTLLSFPGGVVYVVYHNRNPTFLYNNPGVLDFFDCLDAMNCAVNPIIYFFVGRHRQQQGRRPLQQVLQTALTDEEEGAEQITEITTSGQDMMSPEHQAGGHF